MKRLAVACFFSVIISSAFADDQAVKKYRNFTPKQIAELPEKVRSSEVPMMYLSAAGSGMAKGSETLFAMYLNLLMYPGVHNYELAVKQYQRDLGDQPNGVLTVWQIHNLEKRAEMQKLSEVTFPGHFFSSLDEKFASVQGTFVILDDKIAYPINHARIMCYRKDGYCQVDQMYLALPNDSSWTQTYSVQQFDPEIYTITSWTASSIDAVPAGSFGACRTTAMNLNFATKEFYQITRNTERKCEVLGQTFPKLERPRVSQVVDGGKIIAQAFVDLRKEAVSVLASDFRARIEKITAEEPKK